MEETDHDYRIEVDVPGIKIEQIFMYADRHSLSIAILPNHLVKSRRKLKLHEFDASHLKRYISLQDDADTLFMSAEYREGIVLLQVPKTARPIKKKNPDSGLLNAVS